MDQRKRWIYVRVLPRGSDRWIAFLKFNNSGHARQCVELLKQSPRYKGVERISLSNIKSIEGVDAVIAADLQIAGSWPFTEQDAVRKLIRNRDDRIPNLYASIKWQLGDDGYYKQRRSVLGEESSMSFSSMICVMVELWDLADDQMLERAKQRARARGIVNRKRNKYEKL